MHELTIAQSILNIINEELLVNNLSKVIKISIRIGRLTAIEPESLKFCFEIITKNTKAEGSVLEIDYVPIRCKCSNCQIVFTVDELDFICPKCMGSNLKIISGNELQVVGLEAE
ncbi:hydrogenase maturation nickel metallochaperone HypA [candidate division Kazan bacterium]|uniref:Hydrogenase maturation factor HypA n=1 Tax=candidate division Kazan bacterium TaxID=2202143 RepID=A0A420ZC06_UNCK3|nr:hydrogenase maturation nickel metallochaperone HypA [Deltaproteobacteria bacterium]RLC36571.1 MAG: hydrogenase maturation nickel metallochaperone HypA [candidate division Kazan bacterium]